MSEALQVALIVAVPAFISSLTGIIVAIWGQRKIHAQLNSRFTEWIEATKKSSFAEGVKSETDKNG